MGAGIALAGVLPASRAACTSTIHALSRMAATSPCLSDMMFALCMR